MDIVEFVPPVDDDTPLDVTQRLLEEIDNLRCIVVVKLDKESVVSIDTNGLSIIETLGLLSAAQIHVGEISFE